ncbi:hypothetical protein G6F58_013536 [Rhizopus delemar]|nr:hypothetical protein G6F58_013536 [Rhizopus delemar]
MKASACAWTPSVPLRGGRGNQPAQCVDLPRAAVAGPQHGADHHRRRRGAAGAAGLAGRTRLRPGAGLPAGSAGAAGADHRRAG